LDQERIGRSYESIADASHEIQVNWGLRIVCSTTVDPNRRRSLAQLGTRADGAHNPAA
jgi:hypothetical protein